MRWLLLTFPILLAACVARPGQSGWMPENPIDAAIVAAEAAQELVLAIEADLAAGKPAAEIYETHEDRGLTVIGMTELAERAGQRALLANEGNDAFQAAMMIRHQVTELMGELRSGTIEEQSGKLMFPVKKKLIADRLGKLLFLNKRSVAVREQLRQDMEAHAAKKP